MSLSTEQAYVIQQVVDRKINMVISAVAGAGKTRTLIELGKAFTERYHCKALLLTYNNKLRHASLQRIQNQGLESVIECHTYHSATLRFFLERENRRDFHESLIYDALKMERVKPGTEIERIGIVLLDECQDQTDALAALVKHLLTQITQAQEALKLIPEKPVLVLCGDGFQRIYGFRHTTLKYMMYPKQFFGDLVAHEGQFETARLSTSYRVTHEIAAWLNENMHPKHLATLLPKERWLKEGPIYLSWWGEGIKADPKRSKGAPVRYIQADRNFKSVAQEVNVVYQKNSQRSVVVLCQTGKSAKAPVWRFLNALAEAAKPKEINWVCSFHGEDATTTITTSKESNQERRLAGTIHHWRGDENDITIAFAIDGYAERRTEDLFELFCVYYVGCTRASQELIVIQCDKKAFATIRIAQELKSENDDFFSEHLVCKKKKLVKTLNAQQLAIKITKRYAFNGLHLVDVFSFVAYDNWLDSESLRMIPSYRLPEADVKPLTPNLFWIQTRDPLSKENVMPLYSLALEMAIQLWFEKSRTTIPSYQEIYQPIPEDKTKELKEVIHFIETYQKSYICKRPDPDDPSHFLFDWPYLVKMANAYRTISNGLLCKWRQLENFDQWVPSAQLKEMFESSIDLLQQIFPESETIRFHQKVKLPIFLRGLLMDVTGHVFMQSSDSLIQLSFQQSHVSETQSCVAFATSCLYHLLKKPKKTYILSPQQGTLFRIKSGTEIESPSFHEQFLLSAVARKLNMNRSHLEVATNQIGISTKEKKKLKRKTTDDSIKNSKKVKLSVASKNVISSYFSKLNSEQQKKKFEDFIYQPSKSKTNQTDLVSTESPFYKFLGHVAN